MGHRADLTPGDVLRLSGRPRHPGAAAGPGARGGMDPDGPEDGQPHRGPDLAGRVDEAGRATRDARGHIAHGDVDDAGYQRAPTDPEQHVADERHAERRGVRQQREDGDADRAHQAAADHDHDGLKAAPEPAGELRGHDERDVHGQPRNPGAEG